MKIAITCDSTCDLSQELYQSYNVTSVPLTVVRDGVELRDGVDINPDDIYAYKEQTGKVVTTAAANIGDYTDLFEDKLKSADAVIHFNISSGMSSSHNNARLAAEDFDNVFVVDTKNLSTASALLVLHACDMRDNGASPQEIYDSVCEMASRVDASFILDTLEYLHKGGRCSAIAALGANFLKLKPCIEVQDGKMNVGKKYRGQLGGVLRSYVADKLEDIDSVDKHRIFITHSGISQELIDQVKEQIESIAGFDAILITRAGCTISSHCGPNTLGILFTRK